MGWTKAQQKVIDVRNKNVLVSAAAGSGKTAVLVERIITMICEGDHPIDIDRLLVVTFTNAAAAEMRGRIGKAIEEKLIKEPDNLHLQKQVSLLQSAQITTIHSFCLNVIRNYFHRIDLDPAFKIADESEITLMKSDVIAELLERWYEEGREDFHDFIESYSYSKSDAPIEELILQLYNFSMSAPWPKSWIEDKRRIFEIASIQEMSITVWMKELLSYINSVLEDLYVKNAKALEVCNEPGGPSVYLPALLSDRSLLERLKQSSSYEEYVESFDKVSFDRLSPKKEPGVEEWKKDQVKGLREEVKKGIKDLREQFFFQTPEEMLKDLQAAGKIMQVLFELTLEFMEAFAKKKEEKNLIDFNDLEHFALKILVSEQEEAADITEAGMNTTDPAENSDRRKVPTQAALELSEQFEEILIDEYQDSNMVQETILKSISREAAGYPNRFMVGDVKQSIYKFRLAMPEIFMEKYETYSCEELTEDDSVSCFQRIDLDKNFRSRKPVLDYVNKIFEQIMQKSVGGIVYDDAASLKYGELFEETLKTPRIEGKINREIEGTEETNRLKEVIGEVNSLQKASDGVNRPQEAVDGINWLRGKVEEIYKSQEKTDRVDSPQKEAEETNSQQEKTEEMNKPQEDGSSENVVIPEEIKCRIASDVELLLVTEELAESSEDKVASVDENEGEDEEEAVYTKKEIEARAIARRIKELTDPANGMLVFDKKANGHRVAVNKDIVILLRSISGWSEVFVNTLMQEGISAYADTGTGYFQTVEIMTVLNMLRIIDNPRQDIPLTGVLYSPVVGITATELAMIRTAARNVSMYSALLSYAQEGDNEALQAKVSEFLETWKNFRSMVNHKPIHELIQTVLDQTGYYYYVSAMPGGERRKANIDMLISKAVQFEKGSYSGLFHFIRYIEKLHKYEVDFGEASTSGEQDNTVRIMSIHKSKGLEFPIVFVAGMNKQFNTQDIRSNIVLHSTLGVGPEYIDSKLRTKVPTLIKKVIQKKVQIENIGEELRVLYVAMTRAKEKLILTGLLKSLEDIRQKEFSFFELMGAKSYLDWVLPATVNRIGWEPEESNHSLTWKKDGMSITVVSQKELLKAEITKQIFLQKDEEDLLSIHPDTIYNQGLKEEIKNRLNYQYPHQMEAGLKIKMTVSELKKLGQFQDEEQSLNLYQNPEVKEKMLDILQRERKIEEERKAKSEVKIEDKKEEKKEKQKEENTEGLTEKQAEGKEEVQTKEQIIEQIKDTVEQTVKNIEIKVEDNVEDKIENKTENRTDNWTENKTEDKSDINGQEAATIPSFISQKETVIQGTDRGTLYHKALELIDLTRITKQADVKAELNSLVDEQRMKKADIDLLKLDYIEQFAFSNAANRMRQAQQDNKLYKEKQFVMGIKASEVLKNIDSSELILVQGIIDVFFEEDGELVLLDYKSDIVTNEEQLVKRYKVQLEYYCKALEQMLGKRVKEMIIYSLPMGKEIRIDK